MARSEILSPFTMNMFHLICGYLFSIIGSIVAWISFVCWLFLDGNGGLGKRNPIKVTSEYFNWHPFFMSFAFILIMFSSILSFELFPFSTRINKHIHWICHTLSFITAIIGLSIILDCHLVLSNKAVLHSIHSLIGFITLSLFIINYLHGMFVYLFRFCGNHKCGCCCNNPSSKSVHKRIGLIVLIGGCCNIFIGITEKMGNTSGTSLHTAQAIAALLFIAMIGLIFTVTRFQNKNDQIFDDGDNWEERLM